ncbi:MAG TPA: MotA/TolQ/ExbB proton channel family protein [Bacillota bacterium]
MNWIVQGGIFMIPLMLCSVITVAIVSERLIIFSQTMRTALIRYDQPDDIVKKLRQHLVALQTIITIAPMLGLLGTVTGLMKSFYLLGHQVNVYNPQEISTGISEALITTAVGLVIAVVATVFYNYFQARLEEYIHDYNAELNQM